MKKLIIPSVILACAMLAGCAQTDTAQSAVSEASQTTEEIVISESEASVPTEESVIEPEETEETEPENTSCTDHLFIVLVPEGSAVISVELDNNTGKVVESLEVTPDADIKTGKADIEINFADGDSSLLMGIKLSDIEEGSINWDEATNSAYITYTSIKSGDEIDTLTMSPEETYIEETTTQATRRQSNADSGCIGDGGLTY